MWWWWWTGKGLLPAWRGRPPAGTRGLGLLVSCTSREKLLQGKIGRGAHGWIEVKGAGSDIRAVLTGAKNAWHTRMHTTTKIGFRLYKKKEMFRSGLTDWIRLYRSTYRCCGIIVIDIRKDTLTPYGFSKRAWMTPLITHAQQISDIIRVVSTAKETQTTALRLNTVAVTLEPYLRYVRELLLSSVIPKKIVISFRRRLQFKYQVRHMAGQPSHY